MFILDFFNDVDDIKTSFDPFYTSTTLNEATDVHVLHELKDALDSVGVYEWEEVEIFAEKYFDGVDVEYLSPIIDKAADRFNQNEELQLEDDEKVDFKIKVKQFVKIYGQMASIIPYEIVNWEKLFWFLKFLVSKLVVKTKEDKLIDELLDSVDLSTYGLERTKLNHTIELDESGTEVDPQNPNPRGVHNVDEEKDLLDEIIQTFNERWFQGWDATPEDQRIKFMNLTKSIKRHPDYQTKVAENKDVLNRDLAFKKILNDVMSQQRRQELELYKLYAKDEAFQQAFLNTMKRMTESRQLRV